MLGNPLELHLGVTVRSTLWAAPLRDVMGLCIDLPPTVYLCQLFIYLQEAGGGFGEETVV